MPELLEVFNNDPNFGSTSYVSEWINCSNSQYVVWTVYNDQNFDMEVRYAVDDQYQVIRTDTKSIIGGQTGEIFADVISRFVQFVVVNIAATPNNLKTQGYFFIKGGNNHLENIGGFTEVYKQYDKIRTIQSSDSSITVVQNADDIDITTIPGSAVTLTSTGFSGQDLVTDGGGPSLSIMKIDAGLGLNPSIFGGSYKIDADTAIVSAGSGISVSKDGFNNVTINNTSLNTSVTLTSAGGTQTLVVDGAGPTLSVKGLSAGSAALSILDNGTDLVIDNFSPASSIALSSTTNNVRIVDTNPTFSIDVGNTTTGTDCVVINNNTPGNHGNLCTAIGNDAGLIGQGTLSVALGASAGQTSQGANATAVGVLSGNSNQGQYSTCLGYGAGKTFCGTNSVCIGYNSAETACPNNAVQIGSQCAAAGAVGRLAFGNAMESIVATGATVISQSGYLNVEWNGVLYRLPAFSAGTTEKLVSPSSTDTLTNKTFDANATGNSLSNVDVSDLANGTDGELITWDATGAPTTVAVGTSGQVLTSNGPGTAPTFQTVTTETRSYGAIKKTFTLSSKSVSTTWSLWNVGTFSSGLLSNFTRATTRLTYTGATTHDFLCTYHVASGDNQNNFYRFSIAKNASVQSESWCYFRNTPGGGGGAQDTAGTYSGSAIVTLTTNDYIEPYVYGSNSGTLGIVNLSVTVTQVD